MTTEEQKLAPNFRCNRCFKFVFKTGHSPMCPVTL